MVITFFTFAFIGTMVLVVHISIELNTIEKESRTLVEKIKKHYGSETSP